MRNVRIEVSQTVKEIDSNYYSEAYIDVDEVYIGVIIPIDSCTFLIEELIENELGLNIDYE
jgi:hypothetical protein